MKILELYEIFKNLDEKIFHANGQKKKPTDGQKVCHWLVSVFAQKKLSTVFTNKVKFTHKDNLLQCCLDY